ncbi:hydrogenase/urease nickel incorporation protein HypA [Helicobacter hepaticus]|uniref:hydrogenase/urease nickel incorporation protein HypA n=1 Tax=Helicobacter hepaticus TaxID=32025 RepID=UPI0039E1D8CD
MHEYSIVASLIQMCESHAKEHNAASIAKVCIAVGERSGVDSALVKSAFETFRLDSPLCQNTILEIQSQSVELECRDCGIFKHKISHIALVRSVKVIMSSSLRAKSCISLALSLIYNLKKEHICLKLINLLLKK